MTIDGSQSNVFATSAVRVCCVQAILMVVETGNRLQLSTPTMLTPPLTWLISARLSNKKKRITKVEQQGCLPAPPIVVSHLPRSHHRLSFSHHVCCEEVLLLRGLARMRQIVAPLRLRNLLTGHNGETALRLVKKGHRNHDHHQTSAILTQLSKITVAPPWAHGKQQLTGCRWLWKQQFVVQTAQCNIDEACVQTFKPAVLLACLCTEKSRLERSLWRNIYCHRRDQRRSTIPPPRRKNKTANTTTKKDCKCKRFPRDKTVPNCRNF